MPIKVLLAGDTDMMRDAMRRILESERLMELVLRTENGHGRRLPGSKTSLPGDSG
jgi:chemotaxis response regulator CheB